jgi:Mn2+/Fe2+ NRAMP family transporter
VRSGRSRRAFSSTTGRSLVSTVGHNSSSAGAQFGFNMLWTMVLTYPLMTAVQLVSAQIGPVTGCGLAKNMGDVFPKPLLLVLIGLLFIANTINIGANLAAMGAAAELVWLG